MMAEQKFFFILLLSGPCCLAIAPLFLFPKGERNSVSFTAPGLMLVGIAFVLIGCCGFVGLDSYGGCYEQYSNNEFPRTLDQGIETGTHPPSVRFFRGSSSANSASEQRARY